MKHASRIAFHDGKTGTATLFKMPTRIIEAHTPEAILPALAEMDDSIAAGLYLAGYFSYELGYLLEPSLAKRLPARRTGPLLWFGVFAAPPSRIDMAAASGSRTYIGPLDFEWNRAHYHSKFSRVAEHIQKGNIYQANLSMRAECAVIGSPWSLFQQISHASAAAYSAYIDDGTRQILSFSPELFFKRSSSGTVTLRPMKGTAARGEDTLSDAQQKQTLLQSSKNQAENVMIVDLIRNDIGRIAKFGSVAVDKLFDIETYPTLHQMVSTVHATLKPRTGIQQLLSAIFPCGSITGAPKIRAMHVIRSLETTPRDIYCGAIGYFAPDGEAQFNVAIRTLTIQNQRGKLGIGSGIVADSDSDDEYRECRLKAHFFEQNRRPIKLIETLRLENNTYIRLPFHLARLEHSAQQLALPFEREHIRAKLDACKSQSQPLRVRLTLDETGHIDITTSSFTPASHWHYQLASQRLDSHNRLLRHKTNWRHLYDTTRQKAARRSGCDEVLFLNQRDELCEGSRSNVFIRQHGQLLTPAHHCGLLNGCLRQQLLAEGQCREAVLSTQDLAQADGVFFGNSLNGLIPATLSTHRNNPVT